MLVSPGFHSMVADIDEMDRAGCDALPTLESAKGLLLDAVYAGCNAILAAFCF